MTLCYIIYRDTNRPGRGKTEEEKMSAEKIEKIQHIKQECNRPKSELIRLLSKLEEVSPAQAEKLSKIIGRLEVWQNQ
jgi:hypothetical protein